MWLLYITVRVRQIFGSEEKFGRFSHLRAARRNRCCVVKGNVTCPKKLSPQSFETAFVSVHTRRHPYTCSKFIKMWLMITPFKWDWFWVARRHFIRPDEWLGVIRGSGGVHNRKKYLNLKLTAPRYIERKSLKAILHFIIETDSCRNCLAHWYSTVFRGTLKFRRGLADSASNATDKYNFDNFNSIFNFLPISAHKRRWVYCQYT